MKRSAIRRTEWREVRPSPIIKLIGGREFIGSTGCHVIVSREPELHISVSAEGRYPTWDELASARDRFGGPDLRMQMLFPPRAEYVNAHQTTLHLWEVLDGD